MKKIALAATVAALLSVPATADTLLGVYVGGNVWDTETSGAFGEQNVITDFNFEDNDNSYFYAALEHPIPLIPNIKISSNDITTQGLIVLENDFNFGDGNFGTGDTVGSNIDVSFIDYTLYYEIFDNGLFSFDIGATVRDFDGEVSANLINQASSLGIQGTLAVDEVVPLLYGSAIVGIPLTGFSVFVEGHFLSFDDHTIYDYQAGVSYALLDNLLVDLNLNIGYRSAKLELEDLGGLYTNIEFEGVFAGAELHF